MILVVIEVITLFNILGKFIRKLNSRAEKEEKILQNQFGFQKGKSTVDCIFTLHSIISKTLDAKEKLYCVFVDYEKGFDKVDRSMLWHKLITEKVSTNIFYVYSSYSLSVIKVSIF